jgi:hypothetical protein
MHLLELEVQIVGCLDPLLYLQWIALALGAVGVALLVRKAWARFSQVM